MTLRRAAKCVVCDRYNVVSRAQMCTSCCEAYDRARGRDATTIGIIQWAAGRARRFARAGERKGVRS